MLFGLLLFLQVLHCWAQETSQVRGTVIDSKSNKPLQDITAVLQSSNLTVTTNAQGTFLFENVAAGNQVVVVSSAGYARKTFNIDVVKGQSVDLGNIMLEEDITSEQELSLITITENDLGDDNSGSENTAGLLQASRDTYQQTAAFNWGLARFRIRGLDNEYGVTMINGVVMNKIYDGRPQWSNWGGLNDATRNQEFTMGSAPSDYTFGSILGTQEINTRASIYRPGTRVSFSGTNTNYSWRTMATHASGLDKDGFAYVLSASRRWAQEGYFEGTDYSANSFFASVEKRFGDNHSINFTSIYAENSRGKNSPNTKEMSDLAGIKYNSYWGWQNGEKRNSRDKDIEEPLFMLSHYWHINEKMTLHTNVAYQFGKIGNSRIDYQDASNPDPSYYKNLPSFYSSQFLNDGGMQEPIPAHVYNPGGVGGLYIGDNKLNRRLAEMTAADFLANRQMDWDGMYAANTTAVIDENGNIVGRTPSKSRYAHYEDRTDDKTWTANTIFNGQITDNATINAGATFRKLKSHNFQRMLDLLGGTHFEDIDSFYTGNTAQSDLNNPNRIIGVGDTYGYNYNLLADNYDAFAQAKFTYNKADFYVGANYSRSEYQREGLYRNGIYANNSYGKSEKAVFDNIGGKGGFTYKFTGRHMLAFNGFYSTKAPTLRNTFPNARINNTIVNNIESEKIFSGDLSYIIRAPRFKARLTGFFSRINDATETSFFFAEGVMESIEEGDDMNAFVAETVTGINKQHIGLEFGAEYNVTSTIKAMASASFAQYTYTNNPHVSINNDGLAADLITISPGTVQGSVTSFGKAYLKDYKLAGMPQHAASIGVEYRDPKFWWVGANGNYLGGNYMDVSALMRTDNFLRDPETGHQFIEATDARARELLRQEKFDGFFLVNLTGGKSWKIGNNTFGVFASINNLFNTTYKTGGFEQSRNGNYRQLNQDVSSGNPSFGPRYFYGYGRTYFVNLYINL